MKEKCEIFCKIKCLGQGFEMKSTKNYEFTEEEREEARAFWDKVLFVLLGGWILIGICHIGIGFYYSF